MQVSDKSLWVITPQESLARDLRAVITASKIININTFYKIFYRNILHGKCRILSKKQQKLLINNFNTNNKPIVQLLDNWQKYNETLCSDLMPELHEYLKYLEQNLLTDENHLWRSIILEMRSVKIKFLFYGFCQFKPNTELLINKLCQLNYCQLYYPIIASNSISVIRHKSESSELAWLQQFINKNCVIICNSQKIFYQISMLANVSSNRTTALASTTIVQQALKLIMNLFHLNTDFKRSQWLDLIRLVFSNSSQLNQWQESNRSIIRIADINKILGEDIANWLLTLIQYRDSLPLTASYEAWSLYFSKILELAGWPFVKFLTNDNLRLINFWHSNLKAFGQQDISNTIMISGQFAITEFIKDCQQVSFRFLARPTHPIKLYTPNEAAGITTENLVILGANSKFSIESETAEQTFRRLKNQAKNIIFSYSSFIDSEPCQIFPPLINYPLQDVGSTQKVLLARSYQDMITTVKHSICDKISSRMISEQVLCPIKTVFSCRLSKLKFFRTCVLEHEFSLLRGIVCHEVLAWFWQETRTQDKLKQISPENLENKITEFLTKSLLKNSDYFESTKNQLTQDVELEYLKTLIINLLNLEKSKARFEVVEIESEKIIAIGGYQIKVRLDRVDQESDGLHLIDYKTGHVNSSDWLGNPPLEPQIPLYLSDQNTNYSNVSYACLNKNFTGFKGFGNLKDITWEQFIDLSRSSILKLITELSGPISITRPIESSICNTCNFSGICRQKFT